MNVEDIKEERIIALQSWNRSAKCWETVLKFTNALNQLTDKSLTRLAFERYDEFRKDLPNHMFRLISADVTVNVIVLKCTEQDEIFAPHLESRMV